ncbi:MAG: nitrate reductase [FCB group bacterium]|nr:nitrate reductase [FCB group bacterium]
MRQNSKFGKQITTLFLLLLITGCSTGGNTVMEKKAAKTLSDTELSYRKESLLEESETPATNYLGSEPGENNRYQRAFENAPPMIPHSVEDFLPITKTENSCLGCHSPEEAEDAEAPAVPASHLYDIRRNKALTDLNPANYNCMLCHAPQTDAQVLIRNTFTPFYRSEASKTSSNLLDVLNEGTDSE